MKNEKVLLVGGSGFIGANIAHTLVNNGYEVHTISRNREPNWKIEPVKDQLNIHHLDILDFEKLASIIEKIKPNGIINASRRGGYNPNEDIMETYMVNVTGTLNLIKASIKKVSWMIQISSSYEYGDKRGTVREIDSPNPISDYGMSKLYATNIFERVCSFHKISGIALRVFQAYGPYEDNGRLLPYIMSSTISKNDIMLKNPEVVRDFIYVDDVNNAVLKSIEKIDRFTDPQVINIGTGIATSVREIAEHALKIANSNMKILVSGEEDTRREASMKSIVADITKAKETLGWNPETNLSLNLRKYHLWMKSNITHYTTVGALK